MKHGSRIIAFGLILCMMAGVLCALAVPRAMASPGEGEDLYSNELRDYFLELKPQQEQQINQFFNLLDTALNPDNNYYAAASKNDGDWIISIYSASNASMKTWYSFASGSYSGISRQPYVNDTNVNRIAYLFYNGTLTFDFSSTNKYVTINQGFWVSPSYAGYCIYPSSYNNNSYYMFSSRDVGSGSGGFTFTANFFAGERPPDIQYFNMLKFNVGDKWFLTPDDQILLRNMHDPGGAAYYIWYLVYDTVDGDEYSYAEWDDLTSVPAVFAPAGVQNISGDNILALEITPYMDSSYTLGVKFSQFWNVIQDTEGHENILGEVAEWFGYVSFALAPDEKDVSYNTSVEQFYNYYNTYNTTHVVPQNLGEVLYGLNGSMTMPVDVAAPRSFNSGELYPTTVFKYHFADDENYAFNTDILDVVIFENNEFLNYHLRYWYDDTLSPKYKNVDWYTFQSLCEEFDLIIIVSDDYGMLTDNGTSIAYCGSYGEGVVYTDQAIDRTLSNTMSGFAFITKRAIQKQMLFNFNDGITKTYKLMSDYIENRDMWDDSFLLWSASIYNMLDSLNGRLQKLDDIYTLLFNLDLGNVLSDIASKLQEIANNTSPDDPDLQPWYMSLWNFVNQFLPTNEDFAAGLDAIEDIGEEIPAIPTLSPVITLPPLPGG